MYQSYWGLSRSPFSSQTSPESLATSPVHAEALARLEFLGETGSQLGLLLGPAGSGKSSVLTAFANRAARAGATVAVASAAGANDEQLLGELALALFISADGERGRLWRGIADRLAELKLEGLSTIILLDDLDRSDETAPAVVERLLALTNVSLTIVASARPETVGRIGSRVLDFVGLRIDLALWNEEETQGYLETSLSHAGRIQPAFERAAVQKLFELSGGAPRRVNHLAELALLAGAGQKLVQIDAETIAAVQEELSLAR